MITEVSRNGCRLLLLEEVERLSDEIRLRVSGIGFTIAGRIRWRQGKFAGVEFDWGKTGARDASP
jgi:hypothetical protein